MRYPIAILIFCMIAAMAKKADAQNWRWGKTSSCNTGWGNEMGLIAIDNQGEKQGIYVAGHSLSDSLCLETTVYHNTPELGQLTLVKFDTSGNILWSKTNTKGYCWAGSLQLDKKGDLFLLGSMYSDTVAFGSHLLIRPGYLTNKVCFFLMKLDPDGNIQWSTVGGQIAGKFESIPYGGLAIDDGGSIYVSGAFNDSLFRIGPDTFVNELKDSGDVFIVKYGPAGNYIWARTFGNIGNDYGETIRFFNNRLYLSGWFTSASLSYGTYTVAHTGHFGYYTPNSFVMQLDTAGSPLWLKSATAISRPCAMIINEAQNALYVAGGVADTLFAFGSYSFSHPNLYFGGFLVKMDTLGNVTWGKCIYPISTTSTGTLSNAIYEIAVDPCDNVWISGGMRKEPLAINGDVLFPTPSTGSNPTQFVCLSSAGSVIQKFWLPSGGDDATGMAFDCSGNMYLSGDTRVQLVFGSDTVYNTLGAENMLVAKYNPGLGCYRDCSKLRTTLLNSGQHITIYPNPGSSTITIHGIESPTQIIITDIIGREIYKVNTVGDKVDVDISDLSNGLYIVRLGGTVSSRFVKN